MEVVVGVVMVWVVGRCGSGDGERGSDDGCLYSVVVEMVREL